MPEPRSDERRERGGARPRARARTAARRAGGCRPDRGSAAQVTNRGGARPRAVGAVRPLPERGRARPDRRSPPRARAPRPAGAPKSARKRLPLAGEQRVQRVVEVVCPDRGRSPSRAGGGSSTLRSFWSFSAMTWTARPAARPASRTAAHSSATRWRGRVVLDRVRRVEAERVHVEVADPLHRRADHERSDRSGRGAVVVEAVAPERAVTVVKYGPSSAR